jgi:predicted transposase/invertase (TIGR01784 family)
VQQRAIAELMALPPDYPYRDISLRHIAVLQKNLKARQNLDSDLEDVIMALSITYEQIEAEILKKGREEGEIQEKLSIARNMLNEGIAPEMILRLTGLTQEQLASESILPLQ